MFNFYNYKLYFCKDCNFCSKSMIKVRYYYNICGFMKKFFSYFRKFKRYRILRDYDFQGMKYEKNYVCDFCDEVFVRKDSLISYVKFYRERIQSILFIALIVLEFQQSVINSIIVFFGVDYNYDMEVVIIFFFMG